MMKIKLKGQRFYTDEEIQLELQEVLKMLIKNYFQETFYNWAKC